MIARSCVVACLLLLLALTGARAAPKVALLRSMPMTAARPRAASGPIPGALTAAHRTLPFGSTVKVTNKKNGRIVYVRINDRGPFKHGRIIDLTPAAAQQLGFDGLASVTVSSM